jgi:catechol 2,3-dioxygenase-like lactoylglutathione lyase family enzyme
MRCSVTSLDHVALTVRNIPATVDFYSRILDTETELVQPEKGPARYALRCGAQKIDLHEAGRESHPAAANSSAGTADLCFLSRTPLADWVEHLKTQGIKILAGPEPRTGASGLLQSIFIRDPDQNLIEIANLRC